MAANDARIWTRKIHTTAQIPFVILKAMYYRLKATGDLPGHAFDSFGRRISFRFLLKGKPAIFLRLLCNPVSIVRYFEFSFAAKSVPWGSVSKGLDISSPRLFFVYLLHTFQGLHFDVINPDSADLEETREYLEALKLGARTNVLATDVMNAPFPENRYDAVTAISVLEHIPADGDTAAVRKLWSFLKRKGRLIITIPCAREFREEWRTVDAYGLGSPTRNGRYFFQRIYDPATIRKRIIDVLGVEPATMNLFGEKTRGIFAAYEKRWMAEGLRETVKDPYHIASDYRHFERFEDLPGLGVCGLIFEKGA